MLLRSEISDFFQCVWNPLKKSGEILWLNPCRGFLRRWESFQMLRSITPLFPRRWEQPCLGVRMIYGPASGIWETKFLGSDTNSCLAQEQGLPRNWHLLTIPCLTNIAWKANWAELWLFNLLCSTEPTELQILSFADGVKTEQGKRSTFVIAQIYNNSTPAAGTVLLEPRGRFLTQHQWIYCIFDLFTRCLILQQLIWAFCTWDWFFNNL